MTNNQHFVESDVEVRMSSEERMRKYVESCELNFDHRELEGYLEYYGKTLKQFIEWVKSK